MLDRKNKLFITDAENGWCLDSGGKDAMRCWEWLGGGEGSSWLSCKADYLSSVSESHSGRRGEPSTESCPLTSVCLQWACADLQCIARTHRDDDVDDDDKDGEE